MALQGNQRKGFKFYAMLTDLDWLGPNVNERKHEDPEVPVEKGYVWFMVEETIHTSSAIGKAVKIKLLDEGIIPAWLDLHYLQVFAGGVPLGYMSEAQVDLEAEGAEDGALAMGGGSSSCGKVQVLRTAARRRVVVENSCSRLVFKDPMDSQCNDLVDMGWAIFDCCYKGATIRLGQHAGKWSEEPEGDHGMVDFKAAGPPPLCHGEYKEMPRRGQISFTDAAANTAPAADTAANSGESAAKADAGTDKTSAEAMLLQMVSKPSDDAKPGDEKPQTLMVIDSDSDNEKNKAATAQKTTPTPPVKPIIPPVAPAAMPQAAEKPKKDKKKKKKAKSSSLTCESIGMPVLKLPKPCSRRSRSVETGRSEGRGPCGIIAMQPQALLTALPLFVILRYSLFEDKVSQKDLVGTSTSISPQAASFHPESKVMPGMEKFIEGGFEASMTCEMALDANETKKSTPDCNLTWQYQQ
eukprot:g30452.t1